MVEKQLGLAVADELRDCLGQSAVRIETPSMPA
jgi:hypothetical protein